MLSLPEVQQGHYGRFLVLAGIARDDFFDELLVDIIEFEWDVRVVEVGIAMLQEVSIARWKPEIFALWTYDKLDIPTARSC